MQLGHFALGPLRIFIFDSREVAIKVDAGITQSNNHGVHSINALLRQPMNWHTGPKDPSFPIIQSLSISKSYIQSRLYIIHIRVFCRVSECKSTCTKLAYLS